MISRYLVSLCAAIVALVALVVTACGGAVNNRVPDAVNPQLTPDDPCTVEAVAEYVAECNARIAAVCALDSGDACTEQTQTCEAGLDALCPQGDKQ